VIFAVVLAAGQSRRMGTPKVNLPWGNTTVLGQIIDTLQSAGIDGIVVVTGSQPPQGLTEGQRRTVRFVVNPQAETGEMLSSVKAGLQNLPPACSAALIVLGDQPQMEQQSVQMILERGKSHSTIVIPSYCMRRGHPWLLPRRYWSAVLAMPPNQTLRHFLHDHADDITYLTVETPTVLLDIDTPADYETYRPKN